MHTFKWFDLTQVHFNCISLLTTILYFDYSDTYSVIRNTNKTTADTVCRRFL